MAWINPNTSWSVTNADGSYQYFNVTDYNRITNNILQVLSYALSVGYVLTLLTMVSIDYTTIPPESLFNAVERNIEALAKLYTSPTFVSGRIFIGDGNDAAWTASDLNRIEQEINDIYFGLQRAYAVAPFSGQFNFYSGNLYA